MYLATFFFLFNLACPCILNRYEEVEVRKKLEEKERQEEKKRREEISEKDGSPKAAAANRKDSKKVQTSNKPYLHEADTSVHF